MNLNISTQILISVFFLAAIVFILTLDGGQVQAQIPSLQSFNQIIQSEKKIDVGTLQGRERTLIEIQQLLNLQDLGSVHYGYSLSSLSRIGNVSPLMNTHSQVMSEFYGTALS